MNVDVIQIISDKNNAIIANLNLSSQGIAYDSVRGEIFTMGSHNGILYAISDISHNVVDAFTVGPYLPFGLTYDSGKGEIFLIGAGTISVISDAHSTNTAPVPTAALPTSTLPSASPIPTTAVRVTATIPVQTNPEGVAYDSGLNEIFVANYGSNTVSVISDRSNTIVATVSVGIEPAGIAYDSDKGEIFVTNDGSG